MDQFDGVSECTLEVNGFEANALSASIALIRVPAPSRVGYLHPRWRAPATPPTYLLSEAVEVYMYVG